LVQVSGSLCTPFSEWEQVLQSHYRNDESIANTQKEMPDEQGDVRQDSIDNNMLTQSGRYFLISNMTDNQQNSFSIDVDLDIVSDRHD